jgi:hypothetical protein
MNPGSENLCRAGRRGLVIDKAFMAIGVLLVLGAIAVAVLWSVPAIQEIEATKSWIAAPAEVVHSEVEVKTSHSDGRTTRSYTPIVRYLYTVPRGEGSVMLAGDRVDIAGVNSESSTREVVRTHPKGARCTVLYDPEQPWRSVLRPQTASWSAWLFPGIMMILGTMLVVIPAVAMRSKKSLERPTAEIDRIGMRNFGGCLMIVGAIFVAVPMIFGVIWSIVAGVQASDAASTAAWIPVEGTIEEAAFERVAGGAVPKVRYRWTRDGQEVVSTTLTVRTVSPANAARWSQAIFEAVPGEAATIHVDPENPASAVLVPGDPTQEWMFFAAGIGGVAIMVFFGLAVILQGHRFRKKAA